MSLRVLVLISGRGSNLQALLDASTDPAAGFSVQAVYADRPAPGLDLARERGIPAHALNRSEYSSREDFETALSAAIQACAPDLIVLAGFMRVLSDRFVAAHAGQLINIHPSLLPHYPGLHTHQRALDAGDREHGASVHLVIAQLDAGPVLAQVRLPIRADDTAERLAERLLPHEHRLLVACVRAIARGWVAVQSNAFSIGGHSLTEVLELDETGHLRHPDGTRCGD